MRPSAHSATSASAVAFGTYNPFVAAPLDTTGTVSVKCTGQALVTAQLSRGSSGNQMARRMQNGSAFLSYQIYTDATRLIVWGDGIIATGTMIGAVQGNTQRIFAMYGRTPVRQTASVGSYVDTLIITVTF
ncbi:spore coat U domain-containing protein [Roseomonas sp. GCM10028921]